MSYTTSLRTKLIYIYRINDEVHSDTLKIGETSTDLDIKDLQPNHKTLNELAHKRIKGQTKTASIDYELLHTEVSVYKKDNRYYSISDKQVHKVLENSGFRKKDFNFKNQGKEWFECSLDKAILSIRAAKEGLFSLNPEDLKQNDFSPVVFRPEQKEAIEKTLKQFKKNNQMLWNAKMRFGKTLTALEVVKQSNFKNTLIVTHRPIVDEGWSEDFDKIFKDSEQFKYSSQLTDNEYEKFLNQFNEKNIIYFASIQDLRGSSEVGGDFEKNKLVFSTNWDFIIIDEAHEGTQTELGENVFKSLAKDKTKVLHLSGTPYNIFKNFDEEAIYTWDYVMEQNAKMKWEEIYFGDSNPYSSLPKLNIFTFDIGNEFKKFRDEELAFNFKEFFKVGKDEQFVHKKDVENFLNLLSKESNNSNYPYSKEEYRDNFRHSLWMVPGVKEAKALSELLKSHSVFGHFTIANVAGEGDEETNSNNALDLVKKSISDTPELTYSITISCGRLTTGVSVPEWTAVFMLAGSYNTSASSYMQTIFRVQTPATINGKVKEECFVFDFAPDRTLKVIAESVNVSTKAGKTSSTGRDDIAKFLNFCPIIAVQGNMMSGFNVDNMLEQLKKVYVERVVRNGFEDSYLYNKQILMTLGKVELENFKNLKEIIGASKAIKKSDDIDINKQGFTEEQYEEIEKLKKVSKSKPELSEELKKLLEELKEKNKNLSTAISILRGISIRMPLLIYGATLNDENEELTIDNFTNLVDDLSWKEFMPKDVTKDLFNKFKQYYEQDVFRSAGKKIRAMARSADSLTIEDRIQRITEIFKNFRNPDKETVLTPWRVVNMHLGDCLGGYVFFDDEYKDTIDTPRFVNNVTVTEGVFHPNTKILEINSKSGLYPLYVAYNIYRSKLKELNIDDFSNLSLEKQHSIWDQVLAENVFVICKTPMAQEITKRTLRGFRDARVNTKYFENLVDTIKNSPDKFISLVKQGTSFWNTNNNDIMIFDAIVGNPPYMEMDGGASASARPIYNHFVEVSKLIIPKYFTMIMPSRWYTGGKGLDEFRENMLNDIHIAVLHDFLKPDEVFPSTNIRGGICYFLWDYNYNNLDALTKVVTHHSSSEKFVLYRSLKSGENNTFIRHSVAIGIIDKIKKEESFVSFENYISARKPFGIDGFFVSSENFHENEDGLNNPIKCYGKGMKVGFVEKELVTVHPEWIQKYKVFTPRANNLGTELNDDNLNTFIGVPGTICTESYILIGVDLDLNMYNAKNLKKYFTTKFVRFLHSLAKSSQDATAKTYKYVPLQDFSSNSDIDWSCSIPEIDKQLYSKYDLTLPEVQFIESMIKPM